MNQPLSMSRNCFLLVVAERGQREPVEIVRHLRGLHGNLLAASRHTSSTARLSLVDRFRLTKPLVSSFSNIFTRLGSWIRSAPATSLWVTRGLPLIVMSTECSAGESLPRKNN